MKQKKSKFVQNFYPVKMNGDVDLEVVKIVSTKELQEKKISGVL